MLIIIKLPKAKQHTRVFLHSAFFNSTVSLFSLLYITLSRGYLLNIFLKARSTSFHNSSSHALGHIGMYNRGFGAIFPRGEKTSLFFPVEPPCASALKLGRQRKAGETNRFSLDVVLYLRPAVKHINFITRTRPGCWNRLNMTAIPHLWGNYLLLTKKTKVSWIILPQAGHWNVSHSDRNFFDVLHRQRRAHGFGLKSKWGRPRDVPTYSK